MGIITKVKKNYYRSRTFPNIALNKLPNINLNKLKITVFSQHYFSQLIQCQSEIYVGTIRYTKISLRKFRQT